MRDRSGVSVRGPALPTFAAVDDEPAESFYPNPFSCSCLSLASLASLAVNAVSPMLIEPYNPPFQHTREVMWPYSDYAFS